MTHEFSLENWLPSNENFMIILKNNREAGDKPLIQVYFYPEGNEHVAVLTEVKQVHYTESANLITIISTNRFNGYVVVK